jgi:hypothetical protein
MAAHPYAGMPDYAFWRRAVGPVPMGDVDPVVRARFAIRSDHRVVTAGSCFAQHIARHLAQSGFNYFITETLSPFVPQDLSRDYNYGVYTARYGNVYTARQFIQLLKRAYGLFTPLDDIWPDGEGRFFDPFRPQIQPGGFPSEREYKLDRKQHFAAVRTAVEQSDVMVFTLGLTEAWINREDGAVYPLCPGTAAGTFDPERHRFVNFRVTQVLGDMREAFDFVRDRNPRIRFLITVSPVPLVATAEDRHVLVSTVYSKSVLRAVCGELEAQYDDVAYFPSYEIITGNHARGSYFGPDLREVTEAGVQHVMRLFMKHYATAEKPVESIPEGAITTPSKAERSATEMARDIEAAVKVICDEEVLDKGST